MRRRAATLVALGVTVVVVAAAGALVAWHPWRTAKDPVPGAEQDTDAVFVTIASLSQAELRSVELIRAGGVIELDQIDGVWRMTKPAPLAVKNGPLNDLMYSLANLASERVIESSPASLKPYGLDPPSVTIRATLVDGTVRELYLGDRTPAGDSYYLMAQADTRVFTVREHHGTYFSYGLTDFWQGARTPIDGSDVVELRIDRQGARYLEIRRTEDLYRSDVEFRGTTLSVVYPWVASPKPVDLTALTAFVTAFAGLPAEVAVDAAPADIARYGLERPNRMLEIVDGSGNRLHVDVGNPKGQEVYLRFEGDPTVYAGDPRLLAMLDTSPARFASRYAAIVRLDHVDRLAVSSGGATHVLEIRRAHQGSEDGALWLVDGRKVATQAFKDFFTFAISLQIDSFHDDAVTGAPEVVMDFALNTSPSAFVVRFYAQGQEFYAVTKDGKGDILVNRQQVRVLLRKLADLVATAAS